MRFFIAAKLRLRILPVLGRIFILHLTIAMKKSFAALALASLLAVPLSSAGSFQSASAESYLLSKPPSPWITMGLVSLGVQNISDNYLKSIPGVNAIDFAAPILAITATGHDPRTFGSEDYVAKLKSFAQQNQLGDPSLLNDDIFGILALVAAGEGQTDAVLAASKNFLLAKVNTDNGWGFATTAGSDTNTTAAAILALIASGQDKNSPVIQNALAYIHRAQNDDGGITYDPQSSFGTASDSSSTAWAIWALNALGVNLSSWDKSGHNPENYLANNQAPTGFFSYQNGSSEDAFSPVTTAYAAIALTGKTLPLRILSTATQLQFAFRIEGSASTVCEGKVPGPSALDIITNASLMCGFTYHIKDTSFGPYLDQINSDTAAGLKGWLYFVNNISPNIGAASYMLQPSDTVLWYFGDFDWLPTRLVMDNSKIGGGASAVATVEEFKNQAFAPLPGATIHFGATSATTDANGKATISANPGFYQISAEKNGYVRSNVVLLQIGDPQSKAVNLSVNLNTGQVDGTTTEPPAETISFSVAPGNLDFGDLKPGEKAVKQLNIQNQGTTGIAIETVVSGDDLFKQNLKLDSSVWSKFKTNLSPSQSSGHQVELSVPSFWSSGSGVKHGALTFWAIAE